MVTASVLRLQRGTGMGHLRYGKHFDQLWVLMLDFVGRKRQSQHWSNAKTDMLCLPERNELVFIRPFSNTACNSTNQTYQNKIFDYLGLPGSYFWKQTFVVKIT